MLSKLSPDKDLQTEVIKSKSNANREPKPYVNFNQNAIELSNQGDIVNNNCTNISSENMQSENSEPGVAPSNNEKPNKFRSLLVELNKDSHKLMLNSFKNRAFEATKSSILTDD